MITFEEAKELSKGYKVVPISMEIMSDIKTPNAGASYPERRKFTLLYVRECGKSGKMGKIYIPRIRSEVRDYLH